MLLSGNEKQLKLKNSKILIIGAAQCKLGQCYGSWWEKCANDIIKGVAKEKHEILSGGTEKYGVLIHRLFPSLFYKILRKKKGS